MNKTEQHKKALIEALEQSLGVVTTACKNVGIGRTTFYDWCKKDPDFKAAVNDIGEVAIDFVESSLFKQIKEGIPSSTIFFLKTRGKKRGYTEKVEVEAKVSVEGTIINKLAKMDDDDLMRLIESDSDSED